MQSLSSDTHGRLIANCHVDHSFRCDTNLDATTFSNTLERKGKFDAGLLFLNTSLSSVGFFTNDPTTAVLNDGATLDSLNDLLMIFVIVRIRLFKHVFRACVGTGSSSHDFDGDAETILLTSSGVAGTKGVNETPLNLISALSASPSALHRLIEARRLS